MEQEELSEQQRCEIVCETICETAYDCIIIGGGISGISFAHNLSRKNENILVLEENARVGGQINTHTSASESSFWTELGAHTCYNSYLDLLSIVEEIDAKDRIQTLEKCSYVLFADGKIKSPAAKIAYLPLMLNGSKIFFAKKDGKTVKEYFQPIVGKKNYERLFSKLFQAVLSQNADDYPAEIFLKRRKERREDIVRKYSFKKGLSYFIDSVVEKDNLNIRTGTKVENIEFKDDLYTVSTNKGIFAAKRIALAIDPQSASKLIHKIEPEVAKTFESIGLFQSDSVNIIVNKADISLQNLAGIIPLENEFLSVVSRDVATHPELRGFTFHFLTNDKSNEERLSIIARVIGITPEKIKEITYTSHALPALRKQHINIIEDVDKARKSKNIYLLGNYYYGLSLEDCVHRSKDESLRYFNQN